MHYCSLQARRKCEILQNIPVRWRNGRLVVNVMRRWKVWNQPLNILNDKKLTSTTSTKKQTKGWFTRHGRRVLVAIVSKAPGSGKYLHEPKVQSNVTHSYLLSRAEKWLPSFLRVRRFDMIILFLLRVATDSERFWVELNEAKKRYGKETKPSCKWRPYGLRKPMRRKLGVVDKATCMSFCSGPSSHGVNKLPRLPDLLQHVRFRSSCATPYLCRSERRLNKRPRLLRQNDFHARHVTES